jgi:glutamate 5-kinase
MKAMRKIVIKVGTSTLTQGTQKLSRRSMLGLVQQIAHLQNRGLELILVSSGAVATGRDLLNSDKMDPHLPSKQTFASIGQVKLMQVWTELFSLFDLQVGQVLLTKEDFSHQKRQSTMDTIDGLLRHQILPIINENDAVSTKSLCIGNNDSLAALVANLVAADTMILLTDQEGLYTADPRLHPDAELISVVDHIDQKICALAGGSSTSLGTGGMATKIEAAQLASESGTQTIIASASRHHVLMDLAEGKQIGTTFLVEKK